MEAVTRRSQSTSRALTAREAPGSPRYLNGSDGAAANIDTPAHLRVVLLSEMAQLRATQVKEPLLPVSANPNCFPLPGHAMHWMWRNRIKSLCGNTTKTCDALDVAQQNKITVWQYHKKPETLLRSALCLRSVFALLLLV